MRRDRQGDEQSGQITEVGFTLYMDLLERAVQALKAGRTPELDRPLDHGAEIDLGLPALLPEPAKNLLEITELKLTVQPLGIRKIEAGPASGRILFDESPRIDPANLIRLIQTKPKEYRLEGGDKLKFFRDMAEPAQRILEVRLVVEQLTG